MLSSTSVILKLLKTINGKLYKVIIENIAVEEKVLKGKLNDI